TLPRASARITPQTSAPASTRIPSRSPEPTPPLISARDSLRTLAWWPRPWPASCRLRRHRGWTCSPRCTLERRCGCLRHDPPHPMEPAMPLNAVPAGRAVRIGIGGPVGSGKTALVAALCRTLRGELNLAVVTNDIYTTEDADFLRRAGVLADDRIVAVQTGCCPHTAIRDDITANLDAVESLDAAFPRLALDLVESGGDNLTATFSTGLGDRQIFVLDVSGGGKVPRQGGAGGTRAGPLLINKTHLAPLV